MKTSISFLLILIAAVACKDDDASTLPFERQIELLAGKKNQSKSWIVESVSVNGSALPLEPCAADNIFTFYNNSFQEYKLTAGALECDSSEPALLEEGAWMFTTDGEMIIVSANRIFETNVMNYFGTLTSKPGKVLELTDTKFRTEVNVVDGINQDAVSTVINLRTN